MTRLLVTLAILFSFVSISRADKKPREWKVARVLDAAMKKAADVTVSNTQAQASANATVYGNSGTANGQGSSTTTTVTRPTQTREVFIAGTDYVYTVEDPSGPSKTGAVIAGLFGGNSNTARRRVCRFVIGEDIKYWQDKGTLHIIDADGRPCEQVILRQEKVQPAVPAPAR